MPNLVDLLRNHRVDGVVDQKQAQNEHGNGQHGQSQKDGIQRILVGKLVGPAGAGFETARRGDGRIDLDVLFFQFVLDQVGGSLDPGVAVGGDGGQDQAGAGLAGELGKALAGGEKLGVGQHSRRGVGRIVE